MDNHSFREKFKDSVGMLGSATNKIERGLVTMGLTNNEVKVYLVLARKGASKASEIAKSLNFSRRHAYDMLSILKKKGLVRSTLHHPWRFDAIPFDDALNVLLDIEKQKLISFESNGKVLLQLWSTFVSQVIQNETKEAKFQILEGDYALDWRINDMITCAEKEVIIIVDQGELSKVCHKQITDNFNTLTSKSVRIKVLTSMAPRAEIREDMNEAELRILAQSATKMRYILVDERQILFFTKDSSTGDTPAGMWTDCESLVRCIYYLFKELWYHSVPG